MKKIFILVSMLHLSTSLSALANPAVSEALLSPPTQLPDASVNAVKTEPSDPNLLLKPTISPSLEDSGNSSPQMTNEKTEEDMAPQLPTKPTISPSLEDVIHSPSTMVDIDGGTSKEDISSEKNEIASAVIDNSVSKEPLSKEVSVDDSINVPQLTTGHLEVLREIKDRANIKKEVVTINDIPIAKLEVTPTFRYILYGLKNVDQKNINPDEIVSMAVREMLKTIQMKIKALKAKDSSYTEGDRIYADMQNDFERVVGSAVDLTLKAIREEVVMIVDNDYEVFYHAHLPTLRLYYDMLSSIVSYFKIQKIDYLKVIRDKQLTNEFVDIPSYLQTFNQQFEAYSDNKELPVFSDKDPKLLGFGSGPDHLLWAKINMISANLSLLGNRYKLGENTFYYFFNAFSHINSLDFLFESLLKKLLINKTDAEIKTRVQQYTLLFERYMAQGGGNLLQIFIKSPAVKKMTYFSWPYGIPVWLDHTRHLAVINNSINSPLPMLWLPNESFIYETEQRRFMLPDPMVDLKLYRTNPEAFIAKYAPNGMVLNQKTKNQIYDRQQVRIVTNMALITDPNIMSIKAYTRYQIPEKINKIYEVKLHQMIKDDMEYYLNNSQGDKESSLGRLQRYISQGNQYNQTKTGVK